MDFNYWSTTFQSAIQSFGHTVMVFAPWNDPIPLTRAWCLWELYCTVHTSSQFDIAMTTSAHQQFIEDVVANAKRSIDKMLSQIDVARSKSFKESDRELIFKAIERTVGFSRLNSVVFEKLRDWVIESMRKEVETRDI